MVCSSQDIEDKLSEVLLLIKKNKIMRESEGEENVLETKREKENLGGRKTNSN